MIFSPQSKVWIYQSSRQFTPTEAAEIQQKLDAFTAQWTAHGHQLKAKAEIPYNFFIVLTVDQDAASATGCSIDSSVRVIKEIENAYGVDLFNRFNMAYKIDDKVHVAGKEDFETLISIKQIGPQTIVFNNLVQTLAEFEDKWEVELENSWHKNIFAEQLSA
ncbi:ABC transporter ATPase [Pedobacter frigiditerrae]|uniref:ABC transporter ATPase n=1 Tax=Pedobacter frigiditerrae TaxID=2530452 RepID=A0A4R0MJX4_9SPHI|nr:ABC transporter ATPase [Pedobacter frigiditerrae]TCC86482.1 ABC transporter ATPase [Pedobacter frigiditerrae]